MASFFNQLSEDMERVARVVEEGTKFMMGESSDMSGGGEGHGNDATAAAGSGGPSDHDGGAFEDMDVMEDMEDYGSPLMGMADSVMSDIMSHQVGPQTPKEHVQAFAAAITWNEPFIQCLLAFHAVVILAAMALSRRGGIYGRMGLMIFIGVVVRAAEWMNATGSRRWREFATQNYFDQNGIFVGLTVCAPLLVVCLFMLLSMIREASNLLVDVKRMKMEAQAKQKERREQKQKKDEKKRRKKD